MIKKNINILLFFICFISFLRLIYTIVNDKNNIYEVYKNETGIITKIVKDDEKTVLDIKAKEKYKITLYKKINYKLGDKVNVKGTFKTASNNTVFNLFNYRKYLLSKNIKLVSNEVSINLISKNTNIFYCIKNKIYDHLDNYKSKNYLYTFILADTSYINDDVIKNYRNLGISHLFSVSGMHVSFFMMILKFLLKKVKYKDIIIILFLFFYLFLSGYTESLLRCVLFIILSYLNKFLKIEIKNIYLIVLTSFILLLFNPYLIYNIGFLFSVIITFFIILSSNLFNDKKYFKKTFLMSFICFLASIPIISYNFFKINLLTLFLNVIFIPFISFIIFPFGIITFIFPFLDNIYLILVSFLEYIVNIIGSIKIFTFVISKPNIIMIIIYYVLLFLFIKKDRKFIVLFLVLVLININSRILITNSFITYLDVGQGDCIILVFPKGKVILIDTGGNFYNKGNISDNKIIPYLNSLGISKIDTIVLTHGDYDHMGEAINLVENFKVEKVIFNCGEFNELEKELINVLDKKKISYYSCIKELNIDKNKLYFLNNKDYGNENDNSSVIYTNLNNHKFLFMADASVDVEEELMEKYNFQDLDVLKVGHHGSKTSSSKSFIDSIKPKYSVISVGKNNRYNHPNDNVLDNLKNSKIYRTDQDGSVMFKIDKDKLKIEVCLP